MDSSDIAVSQQKLNYPSKDMTSSVTTAATATTSSYVNRQNPNSPHDGEMLVVDRSASVCSVESTSGLSTKRNHDNVSNSFSLEGEVHESFKRSRLGTESNTPPLSEREKVAGWTEFEDFGDDGVNTQSSDGINKLKKESLEQNVCNVIQESESDDESEYEDKDDIFNVIRGAIKTLLEENLSKKAHEATLTDLNSVISGYIDIEEVGLLDIANNIKEMNDFCRSDDNKVGFNSLGVPPPDVGVYRVTDFESYHPNDKRIPERCSPAAVDVNRAGLAHDSSDINLSEDVGKSRLSDNPSTKIENEACRLTALELEEFLTNNQVFEAIVSFWKGIHVDLFENNIFKPFPVFLYNDKDAVNQLSLGFSVNKYHSCSVDATGGDAISNSSEAGLSEENKESTLSDNVSINNQDRAHNSLVMLHVVPLWGEAREAERLCEELKKAFDDYAVAISGQTLF